MNAFGNIVLTDSDRQSLEPYLQSINKLKPYLAINRCGAEEVKRLILLEMERTVTKPRQDILRKLIGRLKALERKALYKKLKIKHART